MMNLNNLTVFCEVMKTGSMSAAARSLNRSQPAVSLALQNLESAIGFPLFAREGRALKPVPEAHHLLSEADELLSRVSALQRNMQRLGAGEQGSLTVAGMPGITAVLLPEFLSQFSHGMPDIQIAIHTRSSSQLYEVVGSQSVDMGMGDFDASRPKAVHSNLTRITAQCRVALPTGHPLSGQALVSWEELAQYPMGSLLENHVFAQRVQDAFASRDLQVDVRFRSQTLLPLLQFVATNQSIAIVDPLTVVTAKSLGVFESSVHFCQLAEPIHYEYALLVPNFRPLSVLAKTVVDQWKEYVMVKLLDLKCDPVMH